MAATAAAATAATAAGAAAATEHKTVGPGQYTRPVHQASTPAAAAGAMEAVAVTATVAPPAPNFNYL